MKCIKHIGWTLLLLAAAFTSCDKQESEDMQNMPGMDIPAGYMKVTFPAEKPETRAVDGDDKRISHLRCLVYKKDEAQTYRLLSNDVLFEHSGGTSVHWPYTAFSIYVPKDADYKVVFLGNVDKSLFEGQTEDLLSGVESDAVYEDASIIAPAAGFDESKHNLYYWAGCSFNTTPQGPDNNNMTVSATLKRIVSRCRLSGYGIKEGTKELGPQNRYSSWFYYSLLNEDGLLGEQVFGATGKMGDCFLDILKTDIIYPIAYMLNTNGSLETSSAAGQWYNSVGGKNYDFDGRWPNPNSIRNFLNENAKQSRYKDEKGKALNQFINDLLDENDSKGYRKKMIVTIKENDVTNLELNKKTYSYAKEKTAERLNTAQSGNEAGKFLTTWENMFGGSYSMDIALDCKNVPLKLGLDLQVKERADTYNPTWKVTLSSASNSRNEENKYNDKMLNLYFLGDKESNATFGFSSLKLTETMPVYALPSTGFSLGGTMQPNKSLDYRTVPKNIRLGENVTDSKVKICFIYGKLIDAIEEVGWPVSFDRMNIRAVFTEALGSVSGLDWAVELDDDHGRLTKSDNTSQAGFDFYIPDFSPSNLTGELEWEQIP